MYVGAPGTPPNAPYPPKGQMGGGWGQNLSLNAPCIAACPGCADRLLWLLLAALAVLTFCAQDHLH